MRSVTVTTGGVLGMFYVVVDTIPVYAVTIV